MPGWSSSAQHPHPTGRTRRCCSGDDHNGVRLEVVGVELSDGQLRVIHAMAMRPGYEDLYEEAKTWRL
jgi:hypothetical protein